MMDKMQLKFDKQKDEITKLTEKFNVKNFIFKYKINLRFYFIYN